MFKAIGSGRQRSPSKMLGIYRIKGSGTDSIMVRFPVGVLAEAGWEHGDRLNIEYDGTRNRLRFTRDEHGDYRITGKKMPAGKLAEGRVRWVALKGRPVVRTKITTTDWKYTKRSDAITVETNQAMEIQA